jgi:hypothetical protein
LLNSILLIKFFYAGSELQTTLCKLPATIVKPFNANQKIITIQLKLPFETIFLANAMSELPPATLLLLM